MKKKPKQLKNQCTVPSEEIELFQQKIYSYYQSFGRSFAWRQTHDPYHIVVSEIMLQQTQTDRVVSKYELFLIEFTTFKELAHASLGHVLSVWQGLGYNRRAQALHRVAKRVVDEYSGTLPHNIEILESFPGIGYATACSIVAFAFNRPTVFIETNIRAVYIDHFFSDAHSVNDQELMPLVKQTIDNTNPRHWYYALMDYGVMLKKSKKNPNVRSAHHTVQSKFEGSDRQIRGAIIRMLSVIPTLSCNELFVHLVADKRIRAQQQRAERILNQLVKEGLVYKQDDVIRLPD